MLRNSVILLFSFLLIGCSNVLKKQEHSFFALNTTCFVTVYNSPEINLDEVEQAVLYIEKLMSSHDTESDVSVINNSNNNFVSPGMETLYVINKGLMFSDISDGTFDITVGPLVKLWGIGTNIEKPKDSSITRLLPLVDYRKVEVMNGMVKLNEPGMSIDLGGIAKGYASDRVRKILLEKGVKHALINLGGNIDVIGTKPNGAKWKIGIQHPRDERGVYIGIIPLSDSAFVTSGDYERFFIDDEVRYHHILDSRTGYPKYGDIISASIITRSGMEGDALSTITFGTSVEEVKELKKIIQFEGVFVTRDKKIFLTEKLKDIFILTDDSYRLIYN